MAAWVAAWVVVPVVGAAFQEAAQVVVLVAALAAAALRQLVQPWLGELWLVRLVRLVQLVGRSLGLQVWLEVGWALAWVAGWVVVEAEAALMEAGREAVAELQLCWPLLLLLLELGRAPPEVQGLQVLYPAQTWLQLPYPIAPLLSLHFLHSPSCREEPLSLRPGNRFPAPRRNGR